jgi:hypothetical protein
MNTQKEVVGTLASIIGRNVGSFLDTASPRHATYRVTSRPVVYVDADDGARLHDCPVTESLQITVTVHPDGSVEGVTTMEEHAANSCHVKVGDTTMSSGHGFPLTASCFFSATGGGASAIMHYDTDLTIQSTHQRAFEDVADLEKRADFVAAKTKKLQTMLATSKVCTMLFEIGVEESFERDDDSWSERAQVTIFKSPFRIDVSRWSRSEHNQGDYVAARVDFEVASIELVQGIAVAAPVFS